MTAPHVGRSLDSSLVRATTVIAVAGGLVVVTALTLEMPRRVPEAAKAASMWIANARGSSHAPAVASETGRADAARAAGASASDRESVAPLIRGVVARANGGELGPVTVRAVALRPELVERLDDAIGVAADEVTAGAGEATVNAEGAFSIPVAEAGSFAVVVNGARIAPAFAAADPGGAPLWIVVSPGASVRGRVVDGAGNGVAHATVAMIHPRGPSPADAATVEAKVAYASLQRSTETDETGAFEVGGLDDGPFTLLCMAPGHATAKRMDVRPGTEPFVVALHSACTISGCVVDDKQRPVRGASVAVARCVGPRALEESGDTVTDMRGHYDLADVSSGGHGLVLQVVAPGFATRRVTLPPLRAGEARAQNLCLEPAAALRARVIGADGHPLARAYVEAYGLCDGAFLGGRETDHEGGVRFDGASAARHYRVMAKAPGHRIGTVAEADPSRVVELRLQPSFTVKGVLLNELGLPQSGTVRLRRESDREIVIDEQQVATDAEGRFRFDDVTPGSATLLAEAPDHALAQIAPVVVGPDAAELRVRLELGASWTGRVVDGAGEPIANARVRFSELSRVSGRACGARGDGALTDARGAFELRHVAADTTTLVVEREGLAPIATRVADASAPAAIRDLGTIRIDAAAALRGVVLDDHGAPLAGVVATLTGTRTIGAAAPHAETGTDGAFAIVGVPAGVYALDVVDPAASAISGGFRRRTIEVELARGESRSVLIDAREDARVRGRVRVSGFAPADPTEVALCLPDGSGREIAAAEVDLDGSFDLAAAISGTCVLEVRSLDGPTLRAARVVTLAPREVHETTIDIGRASLAGHVSTRGDRTPVPSARVEVETEQGAHWMLAAGADGRFQVSGLPEGTVRVRAFARGFAMAPAQVLHLGEGSATTCGFELSPESVVTVRVLDAEQHGVAGARVAAWLEDGTFVAEETTDATGEAPLRALAGGTLQVVIEHDNFAQQRATIAVPTGARIAQPVELRKVAALYATLKNPKGHPAAFVEVTATAPGGATRTSTTDDKGTVRFDFLGDGVASIVAEGFPRRDVVVRVGETTRVSLPR